MSSFPICIPFMSCYFIALLNNSSTMVKRSGERAHLCLLPELGENFKIFTRVVDIWSTYILRWGLAFSDFHVHPPTFKLNIFLIIFAVTYRYYTLISPAFPILLAIVSRGLFVSQGWRCNSKRQLTPGNQKKKNVFWSTDLNICCSLKSPGDFFVKHGCLDFISW